MSWKKSQTFGGGASSSSSSSSSSSDSGFSTRGGRGRGATRPSPGRQISLPPPGSSYTGVNYDPNYRARGRGAPKGTPRGAPSPSRSTSSPSRPGSSGRQQRQPLAIESRLEEIEKAISDNLVTFISAQTGSGKSLFVPGYLASMDYRTFVVVPTVASALNLYDGATKFFPKVKVGYAAEGTSKYSDDTMLIYVTAGHMDRRLLENLNFDLTDILIIDEWHTGLMENTKILSYWNYLRDFYERVSQEGKSVPKLVFLSATPTETGLEDILDIKFFNIQDPPKYKVSIRYEPVELLKYKIDGPDDNDFNLHIVSLLERLFDSVDAPRYSGDILVFMAGKAEIMSAMRVFEQAFPDFEVVPLYSGLEREDITRATQPIPGKRKIVVSTNVAETSITIPNLSVVVDTLFYKEVESTESESTRLIKMEITKNSAEQRAGRVGRTADGICFRLISREDYENHLPKSREPDVNRLILHSTVIDFLSNKIDPFRYLLGPKPDRTEYSLADRIEYSMATLQNLGMLEPNPDASEFDPNYLPNNKGIMASRSRLGVRNASVLWDWLSRPEDLYTQNVYSVIVMVSLIECYVNGYLRFPAKPEKETKGGYAELIRKYVAKYFKNWMGHTPLDTYLNMWFDFVSFALSKGFDPVKTEIKDLKGLLKDSGTPEWVREKKILIRPFYDLIQFVGDVIRDLQKLALKGIIPDRQSFEIETTPISKAQVEKVVEASSAFFSLSYPFRILSFDQVSHRYRRESDTSGESFIFNSFAPISYIGNVGNYDDLPAYVINLASHEIPNTKITAMDIFVYF